MKKILAFVLISVLAIGIFIGCSKKEEANKEVGQEVAKQEEAKEPAKSNDKETDTKESSDQPTEATTVTIWIMPNSGSSEEDFLTTLQPFLDANPILRSK